MGTKVIGQFCSFLSYRRRLIKPSKYMLGVMNVQPEVPSWGRLRGRLAKASVRVSRDMKAIIDRGKMPGAVDLLVKASEGFGVADGHKHAANVVIPMHKKEVLIEKAEKVAST